MELWSVGIVSLRVAPWNNIEFRPALIENTRCQFVLCNHVCIIEGTNRERSTCQGDEMLLSAQNWCRYAKLPWAWETYVWFMWVLDVNSHQIVSKVFYSLNILKRDLHALQMWAEQEENEFAQRVMTGCMPPTWCWIVCSFKKECCIMSSRDIFQMRTFGLFLAGRNCSRELRPCRSGFLGKF